MGLNVPVADDCGRLVSDEDDWSVRVKLVYVFPTISSLDVADIWTRSLFGSVAILLFVPLRISVRSVAVALVTGLLV